MPSSSTLLRSTVRVLRAGPFSTLQDEGRRGRGHQGVARSGAFDQASFRLANRLVGNTDTAPVVEILLGPFELEAVESLIVAVTGTNATIDVCGIDGRIRGAPSCAAVALRAGEHLVIGVPSIGLRTYLSFRGGLSHEATLGSCSYDSLGKIGPPPLADGDELQVGIAVVADPLFDPLPSRFTEDPVSLPIRLGPRQDWLLAEDPARALAERIWTVDAASNRTGIRLAGSPLARREGDLLSEAMVPGAVQLPPNGSPIVLGPDGGTTGGYPVIGVVLQRGLDLLAQCRPGQRIRFCPVPGI